MIRIDNYECECRLMCIEVGDQFMSIVDELRTSGSVFYYNRGTIADAFKTE
jgi:hypothetical protein